MLAAGACGADVPHQLPSVWPLPWHDQLRQNVAPLGFRDAAGCGHKYFSKKKSIF
jgi:hypothetical protein